MKVLVASYYQSSIGGCEHYVSMIMPLLHNSPVDAARLVIEPVKNINASNAGVRSHTIRVGGLGIAGVIDAVREFDPDVIYSHGLGDPLLEQALVRSWPTVIFNHNYAGACINGSKQHQIPFYSVCEKPFNVRCLSTYFFRRCGGMNPLSAMRGYYREKLRQSVLCEAASVCVASQHMCSVMLQNGISNKKLYYLPLFPTHGDPDPVLPESKTRTDTILLVGRLTRLKGYTHLVPAVALASKALCRRLTLAIAGDGPDREKLLALAARYKVPIEWYGWLAPEEVTTKMRQADLLAVPSLWPEPFGLVGIEAGCVGTPAVAYAVGGIPDWLIPGVSGEMAPAERLHPAPLADSIVRALRDTNHWQQLRECAWQQATMFSRERHVTKLIQILQSAASG